MSEVTRRGVEKLKLRECPCCGGSVDVIECAYSAFNPGSAHCRGECKRVWDLGYVDSAWDCGERWNKKADRITKDKKAFGLITVKRRLSISRDFSQEELQEQAAKLLQDLEKTIIGAQSDGE